MKKLNSFNIAWLFAGCFLGAGFVSGQELWQFFGEFSSWGIAGLVISITLLSVLGLMIIRTAALSDTGEMDKVIISDGPKFLGFLAGALQWVFMIGVVVIMIAGAGELIEMMTGIDHRVGGAVFTFFLALLALLGTSGVSSVFSVCVPVITVMSVIFSVVSLIKFEPEPVGSVSGTNDLLPGWGIAAVTYAAYNIFSSIGILSPFGKSVKERKTAVKGIVLGGLVLLVISLSILSALRNRPSSLEASLPMLKIATDISFAAGCVYAVLLMGGLLGTSLSCLVAVKTFAEAKSEKIRKFRVIFTVLLGAVCYLLSLVGFADLIGTVYPIFGYISAVFMLLMTFNYIKIVHENRKGTHL